MRLENLVEEKIKQAIADGEFENLEGAGKPLNLDAYFSTPEDVRAGYTLLKNNNFVPEEVELLREIGILREQIKNSSSGEEKQILNKALNEKTTALSIILERNKRRR